MKRDRYDWADGICECRTRREAATMYALCLSMYGEQVNWAQINQKIIDRWSLSGLEYIKRLAWKIGYR